MIDLVQEMELAKYTKLMYVCMCTEYSAIYSCLYSIDIISVGEES